MLESIPMPRHVITLCFTAALVCGTLQAETWTEFRGPGGQGHTASEKLPLTWTATDNVTWKQAIPGSGWSSPVLYRDRIFLTAAVPVADSTAGDYTLRTYCLNASSGEVLWDTEVFVQLGNSDARIHGKNSHASPTPVVYGTELYVHFGHQGTACLDLDGKILWRSQEIQYAPVHGNGGSPLITDRAVIFSCDGETEQWVVALDRKTGALLWKTDHPTEQSKKFAFSTPTLIEVDGQQQVVSPAAGAVCGLNANDGTEIWRVRYDGYSVIPRPVVGNGMLYLSSGYDRPQVIAIKMGGQGDVTETHVAWTLEKGAPHTPSLLLVGEELYMVADKGVASCVNALTGEVIWQERVGGNYSSSPLYGSGRIYLQSESGDGIVLKAGKEFELLATNPLGERTLASYAVDGDALLIRSDQHLFRIETQ
jgi:outer membrane protein assembly factor BamB